MAGKSTKIVLKVGGSLLFDKNMQFREEFFMQIISILKSAPNISAIVVGGGKIARLYINAARKMGAGESYCDLLGIKVSRLNASLLIKGLGERAYPKVMENIEEIIENSIWDRILVMGGITPGQSTTSVAFECAEAIGATDLIIFTDVDGIYDKDPKKYPDARKFDSIPIDELERIIMGGDSRQAAAGEYRIFDAVSFQILKRSSVRVRIINGEKLEDVKTILNEQYTTSNIGTIILR